MQQLSRPARRSLLVAHVVTSAGWLGLALALLCLGVAGAAGGPPALDRAAYRAMAVLGRWPLGTVALLSLVTGLVLSLGTRWGLARHRWIVTKFWLTLVTTGLTLFLLPGTLENAAAEAAAGGQVRAVHLLVPPSVSLSAYVFMTAVSVLKPWGPTRYGRRLRPRRGRTPRVASRT
jgi:hypothetical protein